MSKSKLEKVLEHLVAGNEQQAKDLLHQVFIEKARAIHEDLINMDDDGDDMMGGDEGMDLRKSVMRSDDYLDDLGDEIDSEEIMGEDMDMDMGDDMSSDMDLSDASDDMGDDMTSPEHEDTMSNIEDSMGDLETALEELKAEFEKLEAQHGGASADDSGEDDEGEEGDEGEEQMDEMFTDDDFDDLAEAIELEKVSVPHSGEVGSGKYSPRDADAKSKSPVPPSQTERFGAKPVKTGTGPHQSGYSMQTPPKSDKLPILPKDNRRKTEFQDMENEQSGNYGAKDDPKAAIDTTEKTFGKGNQTSPLTHAPRK
jgi:hypothetical protein